MKATATYKFGNKTYETEVILTEIEKPKQFFFTCCGCPIRTFDELTVMGFKLDLVTGMYYKP